MSSMKVLKDEKDFKTTKRLIYEAITLVHMNIFSTTYLYFLHGSHPSNKRALTRI